MICLITYNTPWRRIFKDISFRKYSVSFFYYRWCIVLITIMFVWCLYNWLPIMKLSFFLSGLYNLHAYKTVPHVLHMYDCSQLYLKIISKDSFLYLSKTDFLHCIMWCIVNSYSTIFCLYLMTSWWSFNFLS